MDDYEIELQSKIERFKNIRQVYLQKGIHHEWVNKYIDGFIERLNSDLDRKRRQIKYDEQCYRSWTK